MVRAVKWLDTALDDDVLRVIPPEYTLGHRDLYLAALTRMRQGYSKDGIIPPSGAPALYRVLKRFDPAVQQDGNLDVGAAYENRFVGKTVHAPR